MVTSHRALIFPGGWAVPAASRPCPGIPTLGTVEPRGRADAHPMLAARTRMILIGTAHHPIIPRVTTYG